MWAFQRRLIYLPFGRVPPPAAAGLAGAEEVTLTTDDGLRLAGWFVPAAEAPSGTSVIVFNGNGGNRSFRAPLAVALSRAGVATLLFDYRGYGGNPGRPSETGLAADARAALRHLEGRGDVDPERIVYFGESLGAAVALELALERPPAALVLRSPFTSLVDAARVHYPFLPIRTLLRDRYPSLERVGRLACPVLVVSGDRDGIVPPAQSRRLFEAAPEPKRHLVIPGAGHNDLELLAGGALMRELERFFGEQGLL